MTFDERCYELLRQIPRGRVSSYKEIAHALGTKAYRAVGNAMNKNPYPKDTHPCHRVVKSDGSIGGYASGSEQKIRLLREEGIEVINGKIAAFDDILMKASEFSEGKY